MTAARGCGKVEKSKQAAVKDETTQEYAERIGRVIHYINSHLSEELSVETLSRVAGFSKFHFHRQFTAYTGIGVAKLVRLMRLKRASYQLAFNKPYRIIDIALDAGFSNPESFSRAFKKEQGQSPSEFRSNPKWEGWVEQYQVPEQLRRNDMEVKIVEFEEAKIAVLEHLGSPSSLNHSVQRFIEWRKESKLSPNATSKTYGVPYSDPSETAPEEFRFDICGTVQSDVPGNAQGVITKFIPAGRCALVRHHGSTDAIGDTVRALFASWLPSSGESLRDFPLFFHYIDRMPAVEEHLQVTDVYLPLV